MKRIINRRFGSLLLAMALFLCSGALVFTAFGMESQASSLYGSYSNSVSSSTTTITSYEGVYYPSDSSSTTTTPDTSSSYNPLAKAGNDPLEKGKLYLSTVTWLGADAVVAGDGVNIIALNSIEDQGAIATLPAEENEIYRAYLSLGVTGADHYAVDITATGSGNVTFRLGASEANATAVISHYRNGAWTRQFSTVDANGNVTGSFDSFSPIYITVIKGVTPAVLRGTGLLETEGTGVVVVGSSSKQSGVTSPATTDQFMWTMVLAALAASAGVYVLHRRAK